MINFTRILDALFGVLLYVWKTDRFVIINL